MTEIDRDPFDWLDYDVAVKIFMYLDDPGDIVRASCVSRPWRNFIVSNAISKQICLTKIPQLSRIDQILDIGNKKEAPREVGCSSSNEWEHALSEHRIYASLARNLMTFQAEHCVAAALCASSTDNYPEESIINTLIPTDRIGHTALYWSSSGQEDPSVPERLTYKLVSSLCIISEIGVQPFEAYFEENCPIYSAKSVRFRMGHQMLADDGRDDIIDRRGNIPSDHEFVWTYTSPEFPMTQESTLQNFKLPEPVLCIGGVLQIELLGRVQREELDGLFYICIAHIKALGRSLSPVFEAKIDGPSGRFILIYNPDVQLPPTHPTEASDPAVASFPNVPPELMPRDVRGWEPILNILGGNIGVEVFVSDDQPHDSDDEPHDSDDEPHDSDDEHHDSDDEHHDSDDEVIDEFPARVL